MNEEGDVVGDYLRQTAEIQRLAADECADQIAAAARLIADAFRNGHALLLCGNGGSAADCQHMAAELVGQLDRSVRRRALRAIALTTDTSFLTAYANDVGFEGVFARQVEALGSEGDVLLGISTSGNSENILRAARAARERSMRTVGLVGAGGQLAREVDCAITIPSRHTQRIQEVMLPVEHLICQLVEQQLFGTPS